MVNTFDSDKMEFQLAICHQTGSHMEQLESWFDAGQGDSSDGVNLSTLSWKVLWKRTRFGLFWGYVAPLLELEGHRGISKTVRCSRHWCQYVLLNISEQNLLLFCHMLKVPFPVAFQTASGAKFQAKFETRFVTKFGDTFQVGEVEYY